MVCLDFPHGGGRGEIMKERTAMQTFVSSVKQFLVSEDGPTAVEYAVMLALIIIVCLTAIQAVGTNANATFQAVATELQGTGTP
jgi:pilus assembly protein Flp/PilA